MLYTSEDPNAIDHDLFYTPELLGQECCSCYKVLLYKFFEKDSSYRCGYKPQCIECSMQPRLSMEEHTYRLKQLNFNSEGTKRQRHEDQEEFRKREWDSGRQMQCSDLLLKLHRLVPCLYVQEGGIVNDLALYAVSSGVRADWNNKNYRYMGFVTYGLMPEYSLYEFDDVRDIVIRPTQQGWRDTVLRFIKAGLLTEEQADKEFGRPTGQNSAVWFKKLWHHKNSKRPENGQKSSVALD